MHPDDQLILDLLRAVTAFEKALAYNRAGQHERAEEIYKASQTPAPL